MTSISKTAARRIFILVTIAFVAATLYLAWLIVPKHGSGKTINEEAWLASYTERGLKPPENGPREGIWGVRLGLLKPDPVLGWREPETKIPGLLEVDAQGMQHYSPKGMPVFRVLIIGGSVAFGTYSSDIEHTYFNILGKRLEEKGLPTKITVFAGSAWKAMQDVAAFMLEPGEGKPDLVVFVNGLNDLTSGATYDLRYGQPYQGSSDPTLHMKDYDERVAAYFFQMDRALAKAAASDIKVLVALQPSLAEKAAKTSIEKKLLADSMASFGDVEVFNAHYRSMKEGLKELEGGGHLHYCDLAALFDGEKATTFTDMWHFADMGHKIMGDALAEKIYAILAASGKKG